MSVYHSRRSQYNRNILVDETNYIELYQDFLELKGIVSNNPVIRCTGKEIVNFFMEH
eukprot:Pgem_evm1s8056